MKKNIIIVLSVACLVSCTSKKNESKGLEVTGVIQNSPGNKVYLEEIPMASMQPSVVDSSTVGKDGKYTLHAGKEEARLYNIRMENSEYPMASVINDAPKITLNITFNKENSNFPENYEIKGSKVSQQMKDFMYGFNNRLQQIFTLTKEGDSLQKAGASNEVLKSVQDRIKPIADSIRQNVLTSVNEATNPALAMLELGYFQSTAGNPAFFLEPFDKETVKKMVKELTKKNPDHKGLASINSSLEGFIGKPAPEFSMNDVNGKEVKLSSFRGKYLLVDFWASWCRPCRMENPNVVAAYKKFKDKNFTILGVSLDQPGQKDKWVKAIKDDHLTWTQVSDLQFWNSPVVGLYKIEGIPYNVLIDPSGNIIAENLRGPDLEEKLNEVLP